jgi:hypothetical protein
MFVTEYFNPSAGLGVAQRLYSRQGKNKIANRAAANHQNPVHIFLL